MKRLLIIVLGAQILAALFLLTSVADVVPPSAAKIPANDHPSDFLTPPLIVIGDLHGDLAAALRALRLAGVLEDGKSSDTEAAVHWRSGCKSVVVQVGDQIDRMPADREVLELFARLGSEAAMNGGALVSLLGDHEILNCQLNIVHAHADSFAAFDRDAATPAGAAALARLPADMMARKDARFGKGVWQGRVAAFSRGGSMRKLLAARPLAFRHRDTLVVHAGLVAALFAPLDGSGEEGRPGIPPLFLVDSWTDLERYSKELQAWLADDLPVGVSVEGGGGGDGRGAPAWIDHVDSAVWTRRFGGPKVDPTPEDCVALAALLGRLGGGAGGGAGGSEHSERGDGSDGDGGGGPLTRMVVGHTVQAGGHVSSACGGAVWRVDVGLSGGYPTGREGRAEILIVTADGKAEVRVSPLPGAGS